MFILKIFVALPLLLMGLFLSGVFDGSARTVSDLKAERVSYSKAFIETYGVSRRYQIIVIVSEGKKYSLYPSEPFLPEGMTLGSVAELLNRSSEAVIWTEKNREPQVVQGIQSEYLHIPPSRGIDSLSNNRKWAWWGALGSLAASIFAYLYFKRYFGLDWKLDFDDNERSSRPQYTVAFRYAPAKRLCGVSGYCPRRRPAKRPVFNTVIFGAVIAIAYCNLVVRTLRRVGLVG